MSLLMTPPSRYRPIQFAVLPAVLLAVWTCAAALFPPGVACRPARADAVSASGARQGVEAAGEALRSEGAFPWYDEEEDTVRRINVKPYEPPPEIADWEADPPTTDTTQSLQQTDRSGFWKGFVWAAWVVLGLILVAAVGALVYAFLRREDQMADDDASRHAVEQTADRVEKLPLKLKRPRGDFLSEARRLFEAGEYSEAILYLYSYQLVELDKAHIIRLERGKTNGQYLREVRRSSALGDIVQMSMVAFEDVFFGRHTIDRQRAQQCFDHLDTFQHAMAEAAA